MSETRRPLRILSGVQPSGTLHIGNYFGAIRQFVALQDQGEALFFVANLHALTSLRDAAKLRELTYEVALTFLSLGLDPAKATLFKQSDVPEVAELFWMLMAVTPMGLLERAVSYKEKVQNGIAADAGLFSYPALQAADVLAYGSDVVPVGKDQVQHLEITRDLAVKFNLAFVPGYDPADPEGKEGHPAGILRLPKPFVQEATAVVPGCDGQKMSKSYGNTIDLFADDATVKKQIMGIKTDSTPLEAPKPRDSNVLHTMLRLFATPEEMAEIDRTYDAGGKGWGHYKLDLLALFHAKFDGARAKRRELEKDLGYVDEVLRKGAERARGYAGEVVGAARKAVGY
jgi:tryptophanyl-tRNA synthetase